MIAPTEVQARNIINLTIGQHTFELSREAAENILKVLNLALYGHSGAVQGIGDAFARISQPERSNDPSFTPSWPTPDPMKPYNFPKNPLDPVWMMKQVAETGKIIP